MPPSGTAAAEDLPAPVGKARRHPIGLVLVWVASLVARLIAALVFVPYRLGVLSFLSGSRLLALVPGAFGIYVRRFWYRWTLEACGPDLIVEWLSTFKTPAARVGRGVYVGTMCWIAEAHLGDEVLIASRVAIQGGARTHGFDRSDIPMTEQPGAVTTVTVGRDVWIGTGATILTNVATGTVVGAGSVVTREFPARSVVAGVPARVLRTRDMTTAK